MACTVRGRMGAHGGGVHISASARFLALAGWILGVCRCTLSSEGNCALVLRRPTGFFAILGNGDLALAASILSSSALLSLYLIDTRNRADKAGFFIATAVVSLIGIGYYGAVSKSLPNPRTAGDVSVTLVSIVVYLLAAISSWYSLSIAEGEKEEATHDSD